MLYLYSFNESFIKNLTGTVLLSTLLGIGNVAIGQHKNQQIEQKAQLSKMDRESVIDVIKNLHQKGYEDYQKMELNGKNFLFSSCVNMNFSQALSLANEDTKIKIKYLGKMGDQFILRFNQSNTWSVVIITEILDNERDDFDKELSSEY